MITVIAIFSIVVTLVVSELYLVYKNYRVGAEIKNLQNDVKILNYSSR
jgi:cell division protein FtsL